MQRRIVRGALLGLTCLLVGINAFADGKKSSDRESRSAQMTLSTTNVALTEGATTKITASNASGSLSVNSSNTSVAKASISKNVITVSGIKAGSATLTVKDSRNSQKVSVSVAANTPTPPPSSGLTLSTTNAAIMEGATTNITVSNASGSISVVSSNTSVAKATISNNVITVSGVKAGSATLTVKDSRSSQSASISVVANSPGPNPPPVTSGAYSLLAWNDLGMHCMDGTDYSVFSILPPYNNLHAQLVNKSTGKQVTGNVTLTYESYADDTVGRTDPLYGSINSISSTKTNFWTYVQALFGTQPAADHGLNLSDPAISNPTPSQTPAPMTYDSALGAFVAEGIPITPFDDRGMKNFYPMVKVTAKDASGKVLATTRTVLPVSDEMTCKGCHSSTTSTNPAQQAARPTSGWANDSDPEKDWKRNVLRLHDRKLTDPVNGQLFAKALGQFGYDSRGLAVTADNGKPVLCASCHSSNALATSGYIGVRALTHALHTVHSKVKDPTTQVALGDINNRSSCYNCHPGSVTQCLRGAMGNPVDASGNQLMGCQSCHGTMAQVGATTRTGWFNEPNCQACHHDGKRELVGVNANGTPKTWTDTRFATNPNTPASGISLFRFSKGHGNLSCEACHGPTHAEYPSSHSQDNAQSMDLQGHTGTVSECSVCHATVPTTTNGGPHGMHTTGNAWVKSHKSAAKQSTTACAYCHGADYRGTGLSQVKMATTLTVESKTKTFAAGTKIGCYDCHNGPKGD
jgi:hypothetical protein